jgi:hypothetical protein
MAEATGRGDGDSSTNSRSTRGTRSIRRAAFPRPDRAVRQRLGALAKLIAPLAPIRIGVNHFYS